MRNKLFWGGLFVMVAWPATASAELRMGGFYGGGGVALQKISKAEDFGAALTLRGGKRLDELVPHLSVEGELTYSLVDSTYDGLLKDYDMTAASFAVYGRYSYPVGPVTLEGRAGVSRVELDYGAFGTDSNVGPTIGGGVAYEFIDGLRALAEITVFRGGTWTDMMNVGATVEYTF